jgi:YHS domain-containing protein
MKRNIRMFALMAALAVVLVAGIAAQQQSADKAVDPVCGMTVVKANAKATFDYKGATYYFCSTGCKEAFAKEPEKYLKAQQAKTPAAQAPAHMGQMGQMGQMGHMGQGQMAAQGAPAGQMQHQSMEGCPMMSQGGGMMRHEMGRMGMRPGRMGMPGRPMMAPFLGPLFRLYGDKIEVAVENTKDGAAFKITSKDPEVVKAIQVHMAEHLAMMKKAKEAAATAPAAATGVKAPAEAACADCPMIKK